VTPNDDVDGDDKTTKRQNDKTTKRQNDKTTRAEQETEPNNPPIRERINH